MATTTKRGPKLFNQYTVSTRFLRVPACDWAAVRRGYKTEFRKQGQAAGGYGLHHLELPTPVVLYTSAMEAHTWGPVTVLAVLEEFWREPLGAIGPESLEREGFTSFAAFRRYWTQRTRRRFEPESLCWAYRIRVWQPDDERLLADQIFHHLYGEFLDEARS